MSPGLKDVESVHTDQHDVNVVSPVVKSSDEARNILKTFLKDLRKV